MRFADEPAARPSPRQITRLSDSAFGRMIGLTDHFEELDEPPEPP
jgi:hypothetical protein